MLKKAMKLMAALFVIMVFAAPAISAESTYQDIVDELTNAKKEAVYNLELNAPFSKDKSGIREEIDPETGALRMYYNLFSLPGRAGKTTIDLTLTYNSAVSKTQEEGIADNTTKTNMLHTAVASPYGVGWDLYVPYIEIPDEDNKTETYVHLANGTVSRAGDTENGLEDYQLQDVCFISDSADIYGVACAYRLAYTDGMLYCFDTDGKLILKMDRFGNTVQYEWNENSLQRIYDNCGQEVTFSYHGNALEIRFEEQVYILNRETLDDRHWKLQSIVDPIGRETVFEYFISDMEFNFFPDTAEALQNSYQLLRSVRFSTGGTVVYEYTKGKKWAYAKENGYMEYPKISVRYDLDGETQTNRLEYQYNLEPDGYPLYKPDQIDSTYAYSASVTNADGLKTVYTYNNLHDQTKLEQWNGALLCSEELRQLDVLTRMPNRFIQRYYNENGGCRTIYEDTAFDRRGNVTSSDRYTKPEETGNRKRTFGYSDTYNLCIYEAYAQDEDTQIEIRRDLIDGGRSVGAERLYENGREIKCDTYTYDLYGNLIVQKLQTDQAQYQITEYTYSPKTMRRFPEKSTVKDVLDADGGGMDIATAYEYDIYGNVLKQTDGEGYVKSYTYDLAGRKLSETLEDQRTRTVRYDDRENTIYTIDANGTQLLYAYDPFGKLLYVEDVQDKSILLRQTYDVQGRLVCREDANGAQQQFCYDLFGRYQSVKAVDASGMVLSEQYISYDDAYDDGSGIYTKMTVRSGFVPDVREMVYLFDEDNRTVSEARQGPDGARTSRYAYDYAGNAVYTADALGNETTMEYDCFGNPVRTMLADGTEQRYTYNYIGNQTAFYNGENEPLFVEYDCLSREINRKTPFETGYAEQKTVYDARGNVIRTVDANGNVVENSYNARGFLETVRQYSSGSEGMETVYTYDGEGNVTGMEYGPIGDAENRRGVRYTLDRFGRVLEEVDNYGKKRYTEYDGEGNVVKYTDRNGIVTEYAYDGMNRVVREVNSRDGETRYGYNAFGQQEWIENAEGRVAFRYNPYGDLTRRQDNDSAVYYTYDLNGNIIAKRTEDRELGEITREYAYDAQNRVVQVATPIGTEQIAYDKAGRVAQKAQTATGIEKQYTYNENGTVREIYTRQDGALLYAEHYSYDRNGNRVYMDDNGDVTEYAYDGMNRLVRTVYNRTKHTEYEFDGFGNIAKEYELLGSDVSTTEYRYDLNNRLVLRADQYGVEQYAYDAEGNLKQKKSGSGEELYAYDGKNRLSTHWSGDVGTEYTYGPEGLRRTKTVNGERTRYVYDGGDIIGEVEGEAGYKYYRGTELLGYESGMGRYYYQINAHGDVTAVLDAAGQAIKEYRYDAYGEEEPLKINPMGDRTILYLWEQETEGVYNPFRYCGEYFDEETGNIYLRNRYYDPSIGRFITEDPIQHGNNWYIYANNNPVMFVDPWGLTYLIAWSYGTTDVHEFEQYHADKGYDINVDGDTSDWDAFLWSDFTKRSSFARAAYTHKKELMDSGILESDIDVQRIDNKADLIATWNMWAEYASIEGLDFYSHGYSNGPEIYKGSGGFWTNAKKLNFRLTLKEVDGRGVIESPQATFYGCNTANGNFAQNFANTQGVKTYAQTDYTSFSTNPNWYFRIKTHDTALNVYMGVFRFKTYRISNKEFIPQ